MSVDVPLGVGCPVGARLGTILLLYHVVPVNVLVLVAGGWALAGGSLLLLDATRIVRGLTRHG